MTVKCHIILAAFGLSIFVSTPIHGDEPDAFKLRMEQEFREFAEEQESDYECFRDKINEDYARFMENPWQPVKMSKPLEPPVDPEPEPERVPEDEKVGPKRVIPIKERETVPAPVPQPQPQPIEPVKPVPHVPGLPEMDVVLYGTEMRLRGVDLRDFRLRGRDSGAFADGWRCLAKSSTNNLIIDCLQLRSEYALPDWCYMLLLERISEKLVGSGSNESVLLHGFLLNQSGYDVRFCCGATGRLYLLFASEGLMFNRGRFELDSRCYYAYNEVNESVRVCDFRTPGEQRVSLAMHAVPKLGYVASPVREVAVRNHPELKLSLSVNKNLMDMLSEYPDGSPTMSEYARWTIHGNTPASPEVSNQLYPQLREVVRGLSQYEAVGLLLKVAQSFPYGYDDKIWGHDRVFWMDESWFYPYSDCEDHAINFSRLVRDLLGLRVCLIYYPGHLSACVAITDGTAQGDYIEHEGRRYMVCDATYFYASPGQTMPSSDNRQARLIPLDM